MNRFLSPSQRKELRYIHRMEDKRRYADRIKALLLLDEGMSASKIAAILLLDEKSIRNYKKRYEQGGVDQLCNDNYQGSLSYLNNEEQQELQNHLREQLYPNTAAIIVHVQQTYGVSYSISGMTDLLHRLGFVYKKPKVVPGKADGEQQEAFLQQLEALKASKKQTDKLYYLDGVHPQHNTQAGYGWIEKGQEQPLKSNTARRRVNLNGALDAQTHEVLIHEAVSINSQSTVELLKQLEQHNPKAETIYAIADNARYYRSQEVKDYLVGSKIQLIFLPPYAPNLNLIERLWKFFKKKTIVNQYYDTFEKFRQSCLAFFESLNQGQFREELASLLTDKFQIISA